jgi:SAM-dependent methyltransferase
LGGEGGNPLDTSQDWDRQYDGGTWAYLRDVREIARYSVVAGYVEHYCPRGSVLDVGCGEALLLRHLDVPNLESYVGIDCSRVALERRCLFGNARLVCGTAEDYKPEPAETFDVVVFNEVLCYLVNPIAVLKRYATFLRPDGIIVVSMYHSDEFISEVVDLVWSELNNSLWLKLDETRVINTPKKLIWDIRALRRKDRL